MNSTGHATPGTDPIGATGGTPTPATSMASLPKDNLTTLLMDIKMGRYGAMCCIADPNIRGVLNMYLRKFGLNQTLMLLTASCCPSVCAAPTAPPLPKPRST